MDTDMGKVKDMALKEILKKIPNLRLGVFFTLPNLRLATVEFIKTGVGAYHLTDDVSLV